MREPSEMTRAEIEAELTRWRTIVATAFPDKTGALFICGRGPVGDDGLPDAVQICPAYGVSWSVVYRRADRAFAADGS